MKRPQNECMDSMDGIYKGVSEEDKVDVHGDLESSE